MIDTMVNSNLPKFSVENYANWSRRMKAPLHLIHEDMLDVIRTWQPKITKVNTQNEVNQLGKLIPKLKSEWTVEEKKLASLEFLA